MYYPTSEYDSLGARQLPDSSEPIGEDYFGHDLYGDETVFVADDVIITADDFENYTIDQLKQMKPQAKLKRIQELSSLTVRNDVDDLKLINDLLDDILTDKINAIGVSTFFNMTEEKAFDAL